MYVLTGLFFSLKYNWLIDHGENSYHNRDLNPVRHSWMYFSLLAPAGLSLIEYYLMTTPILVVHN